MKYLVLARKYRPQTFADLVGQDVLVRTLTNAFATGRVAHAFLLTGIRGIGKTTTARIIARALNCIGPDGKGGMTINPCGVCTHCQMIAESRHMDVLEMDAASHTGVDDIRNLISTVQYLPSSARMKVYIIDEVHMLSNNAFNALLKTLEEPPPHVIFIFATTEIRKIPVTILSRCQRFDLKRVETPMLAAHLAQIGQKENITAEYEALSLIADAAEGSVRDALSLFDRAIAHSADEDGIVRAGDVRSMLGMQDKSLVFSLLEPLFKGQIVEALQEFRSSYAAGADPALLLQDALAVVHFITRVKLAAAADKELSFSEGERARAQALAERITITTLTNFWQMLLKGIQEIRHSPDPVAATEMVLIRLAHSAELPSPAELIRTIRKHQENGAAIPASHAAPAGVGNPSSLSLITTQQTVQIPQSMPAMQPAADVIASPQSFLELVNLFQRKEPLLFNYLMRHVHLVSFRTGHLEIRVDNEVPVDFAGRVGKCLSQWTGERWIISLSRDAGEATLQVMQDAKEAEKRNAIRSHPLVATILEQFPGAEVTKIIGE